ncbi:MAG: VCBS repeat-containing protein [Bacteroidetes bacterium]|nr:VCBS repeat-containing protein [Bacteroidota bacterium]
MKALLPLLVFVLLIITAPLSAQKPVVQDSIPQLKEWWRADDMQYGKDGMTWLDNFYHGKGVLVVSTPDGVKSWQMRFPGDTENVFTWSGGSAAIKTGDFNGDGIVDYIDGQGNVYIGLQKGEPPQSEPSGKGFNPSIISDINTDGYDDLLATEAVILGKSDISKLEVKSLVFPELDSNNVPTASYIKSPGEIRVICHRYYWTNQVQYPYRRVNKDGLRLVRVYWDGNGLKSEKLDEFTVNTNDSTGLLWKRALISLPNGKNYLICATIIKGNNQTTDVTIYNVNNDKLEKLYSKRIDGISSINQLNKSIDGDDIPSFFINQYKLGVPTLHFYKGNIADSLHEIAQFTTVQIAYLTSTSDINGDGKADLALSNHYFPSLERFRFSVISLKDTVTLVEENKDTEKALTIESISPMPVPKEQIIQIKVNAPKIDSYTLSLFDGTGKKLIGKVGSFQLTGEQLLYVNLGEYKVSSGMYVLRIEGHLTLAQCSILIN